MTELKMGAPVAVLGATGYVGSRLIPRLLDAGYPVRAVARNPDKLRSRSWAGHPRAELVAADVFDRASLTEAVRGCQAVYYLVHSMNPGTRDFAHADRQAAENMAAAAAAGGAQRIIYLGGLGEEGAGLSHHLASRAEVAGILRAGPVPVTVLRAAMIIGSGSASFEILRYLVERLPIIITPRWIDTPCQPIAVRNVLGYLIGCLECQATVGETFDIGQEEVVTYHRLMEIYAEEAGLSRRLIIPVPVLTPRLSSYWIHLVTPVPASLARPLAEGLRNPVFCRDHRIRTLIPQSLIDCRQAIRLAQERLRQQAVESSWSDAGRVPPAEWSNPDDPHWAGGTILEDGRRIVMAASPEEVWSVVVRVGGSTGWYYGDWLWQLRGVLDRLVGGVGLDRGRRNANELQVGDALDFWRVASVERPRRLLLAAEMKLPGQAVLEFRLQQNIEKQTELQQTARFLPRGLWGLLYWYAVLPFHGLVFNGMLRGIAKAVNRPLLAGPERAHARPDSGQPRE
jgi:uncharacterized protein YbjT (DUF2867 family)